MGEGQQGEGLFFLLGLLFLLFGQQVLLSCFQHLFEFFDERFGDPDLAAGLADKGRDLFHKVKLAAFKFFQVDLFGAKFPAAGFALGLFGAVKKGFEFFIEFAVQSEPIIHSASNLDKFYHCIYYVMRSEVLKV